MISGTSQTQKATYFTIPLTEYSGKDKIVGTEVRLVAAKGWGWQTVWMTEGRGCSGVRTPFCILMVLVVT